MKEIFVLVLITILALIGYRWTYTDTRGPKCASPIFFSEFLYILLGLLMGPVYLNLIDSKILNALTPLLFLGLGWIGMLFGIQLNFKDIVKFPKSFFGVMISQSLVPLLMVFFAFAAYFNFFYKGDDASRGILIVSAMVLAAAAACTSQSTIAVIGRRLKSAGQRNIVNLMRYASSLDDMVAIPVVGLAFAYEGFHTIRGEVYFHWWDVLLTTILLGLLAGFLLNFIVRITEERRELFLVVIGMVILAVGGARYLNVSPLLMSAIAGIVLANMSAKQDEIMDILLLGEKPIFLIFLVTVGALIDFTTSALVVVPIYICVRFLGKIAGGYGASLIFKTYFKIPGKIGFGLIPQGSMAVAIALSFHQSIPEPLGKLIITSVAASVLLNEAMAPRAIWFVIGDSQENNRNSAD